MTVLLADGDIGNARFRAKQSAKAAGLFHKEHGQTFFVEITVDKIGESVLVTTHAYDVPTINNQ